MESLRGHLLIAAPSLFDYFRRAVILVIDHGEEGAMGVILNRESETEVADAVPSLAPLVDVEETLRVGGPVSPDSVVAIGEFHDPAEAGRQISGDLGVLDPERGDVGLHRVRIYAGYAGWAPDQLEEELRQDAWIVEPAEPDDVFRDEDLWPLVLRRKGGPYKLMAGMPADPSLN